MANTFKFGNGNWAVKDGYALAYNDENNNFKPLPFDFTRASSATTLNRQGLIETVPSGKPRIDFLNNTDGHLLLEPSRTNSVQRTEEFDNTYWTKINSTITANQAISPDGSQTADKYTHGGSSAANYIFGSAGSVTSGTQCTFSVFVKKGTGTFVQLLYSTSGFGSLHQNFDIENGVIGSSSGDATAFIDEYPNGWYRIGITDTATSSTSANAIISLAQSNTSGRLSSFTSSDDFYVWGAQVEQGSYPTSYIPTEGSSVTRVLDEADQTGVQQVIGQTEGTLYLEFVPLDASALQILFQIRSSSGSVGQIDLRLQSGAIRTLGSDGGSTQFSFSGGSYTVGTTYKVAVRYKTNDTKLYINGSSSGSDTSCSFTSSTKAQISFSENVGSNFPALAEIKDARLYDTALTDTELQNLTS